MACKTSYIEKIYDKHAKRLYNLALRFLGNSAEAEDAMQESVIELYKIKVASKAGTVILNVGGWLTRVCRRKCIDILRQREVKTNFAEQVKAEQLPDIQDITTIDHELERNIVESLEEAIEALPEKVGMVMRLKLLEGFDYEEIAQITGISQSGVRSQFLRGKERLREHLKHLKH